MAKRYRSEEGQVTEMGDASEHNAAKYISSVKAFPALTAAEELLTYFKTHQILHIKDYLSQMKRDDSLLTDVIKATRTLYAEAPGVFHKSFSLESNGGKQNQTASSIFGPEACPPGVYYSSFIAQGSKTPAVKDFCAALPMPDLPFSTGTIACTKPIWVFVGKNDGTGDLLGRSEHVDAVTHDGTWHGQCAGSKVWLVRPVDSPEWGVSESNRLMISDEGAGSVKSNGTPRLRIECNTGDVLLVNTRIWWHQTSIPPTDSDGGLSISYARDFVAPELRLNYSPPGDRSKRRRNTGDDDDDEEEEEECSGVGDGSEGGDEADEEEYTNLEGLYASRSVATGDVVLMQDEMPDCSLPRAEDPTCEVVWLESGEGALVALVDLQIGDWLTIAESDSEEEGGGSDEEGCAESDYNDEE